MINEKIAKQQSYSEEIVIMYDERNSNRLKIEFKVEI